MTAGPYNPLDKANLARSIENALLEQDAVPFSRLSGVRGAGVYVIYYTGAFPPYKRIAEKNVAKRLAQPIYVGKAIPKGGRKGGISADAATGRALAERLGQHASSIEQVTNLDIGDFRVRCLVVDDIWIPLGENMLIESFKPLWNRAIDGFGNKDPGNRRATQYRSPWDILHPGRSFAAKLADSPLTLQSLEQRVSDYLEGRPLQKLPVNQQFEAEAEMGDENASLTI